MYSDQQVICRGEQAVLADEVAVEESKSALSGGIALGQHEDGRACAPGDRTEKYPMTSFMHLIGCHHHRITTSSLAMILDNSSA
jgi:hypothetical protein